MLFRFAHYVAHYLSYDVMDIFKRCMKTVIQCNSNDKGTKRYTYKSTTKSALVSCTLDITLLDLQVAPWIAFS